tara:strand:+ start:5961 stop:6185 length:225 start_codon:yes stop_codon:yes gene_type:complete
MISDVMHLSTNANLTGFTYTQVYASSAASPTINGVVVALAAGSTVNIVVRSISSTANVYVLGNTRFNPPQFLKS